MNKRAVSKASRIPFAILMMVLLNACVVVGQHKASSDEVAKANVDLAAEYYRIGQLETALSTVNKALDADPEFVEANTLIALIYTQLNKNEKAKEHYEIAIEHVDSDTVLYGQVHNNYGAFLCADKQYSSAEEHFLLAIENKLYKSPSAAYENAAFCALEQKDNKKARLYFNKVLEISTKTDRVLIEIAKLDILEENFMDALVSINRFHKMHKPVAQSLWVALQAEVALGNTNKAQKLLTQIKQEFPESAERAMGHSLLKNK